MVKITKAMIATDLKKVARRVKGTPTRSQYRKHGSFASDTVEVRFGSWTKALKSAMSR